MKKLDLTNQKYGRLTVISRDQNSKRSSWNCLCDCGNAVIVQISHLRSNHTQSCGCLLIDTNREKAHKLYENNSIYENPSIATARSIWNHRYHDGDLSFEDFLILSKMDCHYCGGKPNNCQNTAKDDPKSSQYAKDNGDYIYNGLDRVDNSKSHNLNNVVPCCKICNYAKRERSLEDFLIWGNKLYQNLKE